MQDRHVQYVSLTYTAVDGLCNSMPQGGDRDAGPGCARTPDARRVGVALKDHVGADGAVKAARLCSARRASKAMGAYL